MSGTHLVAGERIPYEASPASIPQRHVAGENPDMSPGKRAIVVVSEVYSPFSFLGLKAGLLKSKEYDWSLHGKSFRNLQYLSTPMNLQSTTFVRQSNVNPLPEAPPPPSGSPSGSM
ncbi:hypothetical protein Tco_0981183 [Tanacetum coccineum]